MSAADIVKLLLLVVGFSVLSYEICSVIALIVEKIRDKKEKKNK